MPHKMMNSQIADVLHDNRLSIEARMLYAYLCSFDDGAPPSTCQIIRQLGIGKTRFYRYRNELEAFGLIEVENTITSGGGVAKYSFPDKPVPTAEAEEILINRLINNNNKATSAISDAPMRLLTLRLSRTPASDGSRRISGKSSKHRISHRQNSTCSPSSWAIQGFGNALSTEIFETT